MSTPIRPAALLWATIIATIAVWLFPGLFGREPWKPDEAYTFGLVWHYLQHGDWLVPTLAGEPFMEKPPIFFWVATLFAQLFGSWLGPVNAARLASALFIAITLAALGQAGRIANGAGQGRWSVLALVGCIGLLVHAHQLITDLALLAGMSLGLLGLIYAPIKPRHAALALGTGAGIAFLSKGLLGPGMLGLTALSLPLFGPEWRHLRYLKLLLGALLVALPWLLIWPLLLWLQHPEQFHTWFWVNNLGRFLGQNQLGPTPEPGGYFLILTYFALPALPLAALTLWRERQAWRSPALLVPAVAFVVGFAVLQSAADARSLYALPLLLPLALLAGRCPPVPQGESRWQTWLVPLGFAVLIALVALGWWALLNGHPAPKLDRMVAARWLQPAPQPFQSPMLLVPLFLIALPVLLARCQLAGRPRFLLQWATGLALVWATFILLYLPWLAQGNDYRGLTSEIRQQVEAAYGRQGARTCVASRDLGEPQRALLDYYQAMYTEREESGRGANCRLLLVQGDPLSTIHQPRVGWVKIWQGARTGDRRELLSLFEKR